jgi:hypothetical protein
LYSICLNSVLLLLPHLTAPTIPSWGVKSRPSQNLSPTINLLVQNRRKIIEFHTQAEFGSNRAEFEDI